MCGNARAGLADLELGARIPHRVVRLEQRLVHRDDGLSPPSKSMRDRSSGWSPSRRARASPPSTWRGLALRRRCAPRRWVAAESREDDLADRATQPLLIRRRCECDSPTSAGRAQRRTFLLERLGEHDQHALADHTLLRLRRRAPPRRRRNRTRPPRAIRMRARLRGADARAGDLVCVARHGAKMDDVARLERELSRATRRPRSTRVVRSGRTAPTLPDRR